MTALSALAFTAQSASAAPPKPKKPITGAYDVSLLMDPTIELAGQGVPVPFGDCEGVNPAAWDAHPFTAPGAGKLEVNLVGSSLPQADWDMYLLDASGAAIASSTGPTSTEQILLKFKKKEKVTIKVCNLIGDQAGHVSYKFTFTTTSSGSKPHPL